MSSLGLTNPEDKRVMVFGEEGHHDPALPGSGVAGVWGRFSMFMIIKFRECQQKLSR